jgi:hypothetical protein
VVVWLVRATSADVRTDETKGLSELILKRLWDGLTLSSGRVVYSREDGLGHSAWLFVRPG